PYARPPGSGGGVPYPGIPLVHQSPEQEPHFHHLFTPCILLPFFPLIVAVSSPLKLGHSICAMKLDEGPCKAILVRYYFNIQNRKCETFEYGGCKGNENNFLTLEECKEKCVVTGQFLFSHHPRYPDAQQSIGSSMLQPPEHMRTQHPKPSINEHLPDLRITMPH
uniref:BPTI/Kunitz inhibitor domain-containing protein n=1 Tax=Crocodylus porosus TaxID=8502 RepID=A0A7M4FT84_CROPO